MLDGQNSVVAAETEIGNKVSPIGLAVAVADGTEYPRAVDLVAVVLGIKHAVLCGVVMVDLGVLRVNVIDRACKLSDCRNGIFTLGTYLLFLTVAALPEVLQVNLFCWIRMQKKI